MTDCIREQIIQAFVATLEDIPGVDAPTVERNRDAPVDQYPCLIVIDGQQEATYENHLAVRYAMEVIVEGYVTANTTAELGAALNELYAKTIKAAKFDITLGNLSTDIIENGMFPDLGRGEGQKPVGAFVLNFTIDYSTAELDPYQLAL